MVYAYVHNSEITANASLLASPENRTLNAHVTVTDVNYYTPEEAHFSLRSPSLLAYYAE